MLIYKFCLLENFLERLMCLFEKLGFAVKTYDNLTKKQIYEYLQLYANKCDDYEPIIDCFVCCVMSHGLENGIYDIEGCPVMVEKLKSFFYTSKCKGLRGKPKLFFIAACQEKVNCSGYSDISIVSIVSKKIIYLMNFSVFVSLIFRIDSLC